MTRMAWKGAVVSLLVVAVIGAVIQSVAPRAPSDCELFGGSCVDHCEAHTETHHHCGGAGMTCCVLLRHKLKQH